MTNWYLKQTFNNLTWPNVSHCHFIPITFRLVSNLYFRLFTSVCFLFHCTFNHFYFILFIFILFIYCFRAHLNSAKSISLCLTTLPWTGLQLSFLEQPTLRKWSPTGQVTIQNCSLYCLVLTACKISILRWFISLALACKLIAFSIAKSICANGRNI